MPFFHVNRMLIVALATALPSAAGAQATPAGSASPPLTLQATCAAQGQVPVMRVRIVNASNQTRAVVLGFTADDGKTHVVDSLHVATIRLATGAEEVHVYVNPKYALTTGTPWIVSLAPGAAHDLELPFQDFISTMNYARLDPAVAGGGGRLVLEARPAGRQSSPVWTGKIDTTIGGACLQ